MANLKISQVVSMRPELTVRPDLIQSLKLLMEPILTLEQVLRQNLSENPLLEEIEEEKEDIIPPEVPEPRRKDDQTINDNKIDWQEYLGEDNEWTSGSYKDFSERDDDDFEHTQVVEKTLYDHLFEQLGYSRMSDEEIEIGAYIIGNIDESGFLKFSVETIAEELGLGRIINTTILGAYSRMNDLLSLDDLLEAMAESAPGQTEENIRAAKRAYNLVVVRETGE